MDRRVLGIDPGIANTGWAILDITTEQLIDVGIIRTRSKQDIDDRLSIIMTELIDKICLLYTSPSPRD